ARLRDPPVADQALARHDEALRALAAPGEAALDEQAVQADAGHARLRAGARDHVRDDRAQGLGRLSERAERRERPVPLARRVTPGAVDPEDARIRRLPELAVLPPVRAVTPRGIEDVVGDLE